MARGPGRTLRRTTRAASRHADGMRAETSSAGACRPGTGNSKDRRTAEAEETMKQVVSGQDLIDAGMAQGKWFRDALDAANTVLSEGGSMEGALEAARA